MQSDRIDQRIRGVLDAHGRLGVPAAHLDEGADLYDAGLTSLARVDVMLGLEDEFDVEFPARLLRHSVFDSIVSIRAAVAEVLGGARVTGDGE